MKRKSPMRRAQLKKKAAQSAKWADRHVVCPTVNRFVDEGNGFIRAVK